jgi:hypothetical protein
MEQTAPPLIVPTEGRMHAKAGPAATLSLKIPLALRVRLKIAAAQRGLTMTELLIRLLEQLDGS